MMHSYQYLHLVHEDKGGGKKYKPMPTKKKKITPNSSFFKCTRTIPDFFLEIIPIVKDTASKNESKFD